MSLSLPEDIIPSSGGHIANHSYFMTQHAPQPIVDLTSKDVQKRLSTSALKLFFNMIDIWKIKSHDARLLLGGVASGPYSEMKKNPEGHPLNADCLQRVSYLVGIFNALNIIHGQEIADDWIKLPNANPIFNRTTPLDYIVKGGIPALQTVRRLLEAQREGF